MFIIMLCINPVFSVSPKISGPVEVQVYPEM